MSSWAINERARRSRKGYEWAPEWRQSSARSRAACIEMQSDAASQQQQCWGRSGFFPLGFPCCPAAPDRQTDAVSAVGGGGGGSSLSSNGAEPLLTSPGFPSKDCGCFVGSAGTQLQLTASIALPSPAALRGPWGREAGGLWGRVPQPCNWRTVGERGWRTMGESGWRTVGREAGGP